MENIHDVNADTSNGTNGSDTTEDLDLFVGEEENSQQDVDTLKEKLKKTEDANKRLYARLKEKAKEIPQVNKENNTSTANDYFTKDEAILIAQGMDLEALECAKLIQRGAGSTLKEAIDNPLFKSYLKEKEVAEISRKAQLGASGGSSSASEEFKPNMSESEHRELWKKYQK